MDEEVKVKVRYGDIEVEVSGPSEKIAEIIPQIVDKIRGNIAEAEISGRGKTCKELIEELWREGWFKEKRKLSDVYKELSKRGYYFDKSAISHALSSLVKEGILTRMGRERRYLYVQKIPATQNLQR